MTYRLNLNIERGGGEVQRIDDANTDAAGRPVFLVVEDREERRVEESSFFPARAKSWAQLTTDTVAEHLRIASKHACPRRRARLKPEQRRTLAFIEFSLLIGAAWVHRLDEDVRTGLLSPRSTETWQRAHRFDLILRRARRAFHITRRQGRAA